MKIRFVSKLRGQRLQWGLTQRELAPLVCIKDVTQLSRVEHGTRPPSALCAISAMVVFGKSLEELFPELILDVEDRIGPPALKLYYKVENRKSMAAMKKRELLLRIAQVKRAL